MLATPLCGYMHICLRTWRLKCVHAHVCVCVPKPERGFIKGWGIDKEMQRLSSVLWKMKVFPQATHGHFHSFYLFPPSPHLPLYPQPITSPELTQQQQQSLQGAEYVCVRVWEGVSWKTWVIWVSFLPKRKSWSGCVHCGFVLWPHLVLRRETAFVSEIEYLPIYYKKQ